MLDKRVVWIMGAGFSAPLFSELISDKTLKQLRQWPEVVKQTVVQSNELFNGSISAAADDAFDQGAIVLAPTGNSFDVTAPSAPGNAHKVLAVGAFDANTGDTVFQRNGLLSAARSKPDLQGPSGVTSAASTVGGTPGGTPGNTAQQGYSATSCSTPFIGGVAAILRDWYASWNSTTPGRVYSALLALGDEQTNSLITGTGRVSLPTCSTWWSAQRTFTNANAQSVSLNMPAGRKDLSVAIWWSEAATATHTTVGFVLKNPSGVTEGTANSASQVRQKWLETGSLVSGSWTLVIDPDVLNTPNLVVHYTAMARCL